MFRIIFNNLPSTFSTITSKCLIRPLSSNAINRPIILGIETSCDDTGCAIIDGNGTVFSDVVHSQTLFHIKNGGVIPPLAQDLHRMNIEPVVNETITKSDISWNEIDAIAVTTKPGLPLSLATGLKYAKYLANQHSKPIIPIHHMEAHALTIRAKNDIEFPFLCLLISGGHCLLTLVKDVNDFLLLGESTDTAPGEVLDKAARRLKLHNIDEFSKMSGGRAVEMAAKKSTNIEAYQYVSPLLRYRDCNFSFAGLKSHIYKSVSKIETSLDLMGDDIIPDVYDICAAFQLSIARHICHRTQRAMEYVIQQELIPNDKRVLVVSGGVACNDFIFDALKIVCDSAGFDVIRPPPKLCTDNGVMIAWNGVEKWQKNIDIYNEFGSLKVKWKCPLGVSINDDVIQANIACKMLPLTNLYSLQVKSRVE